MFVVGITTDSYVSAVDVSKYGMKNGSKTGYSVTANTKLFNNYLYTGAEYIWDLADMHDKAYKLIVKTPETKKGWRYAVCGRVSKCRAKCAGL